MQFVDAILFADERLEKVVAQHLTRHLTMEGALPR